MSSKGDKFILHQSHACHSTRRLIPFHKSTLYRETVLHEKGHKIFILFIVDIFDLNNEFCEMNEFL